MKVSSFKVSCVEGKARQHASIASKRCWFVRQNKNTDGLILCSAIIYDYTDGIQTQRNNRSKFIKYHCSSPIGCSLQLALSLASCSLTPVLCLCSFTTSMNLFHAPFPSRLAPLYSTRLLLNIVECVKLIDNQRNHLLSVSVLLRTCC